MCAAAGVHVVPEALMQCLSPEPPRSSQRAAPSERAAAPLARRKCLPVNPAVPVAKSQRAAAQKRAAEQAFTVADFDKFWSWRRPDSGYVLDPFSIAFRPALLSKENVRKYRSLQNIRRSAHPAVGDDCGYLSAMIHARNYAFQKGLSDAAHSLPNAFFDGLWLVSRPDSGVYNDPFSLALEVQAFDDPFPGGDIADDMKNAYIDMCQGALCRSAEPPPSAPRGTSHRVASASAARLCASVDIYAPCLCAPALPMSESALLSAPPALTQPCLCAPLLDEPLPDAAMLLCAPALPMSESALLSAPPASTQPNYLPADVHELSLPQSRVEPLPLCAPSTLLPALLCETALFSAPPASTQPNSQPASGNLSTCDAPMPLSAPSAAEPTCDEPMPMCAPSTDEPMPLSAPSIAEPTCDEPTPMCAPSTVEQKCGACRPKRGVRGGRRGHRARYLQSYC